jgi:hypothetical protein
MEWNDDVKRRNGAQGTKTCLSIRGEETNVAVGTEQQKVRYCTASPVVARATTHRWLSGRNRFAEQEQRRVSPTSHSLGSNSGESSWHTRQQQGTRLGLIACSQAQRQQ